MGCRKSKIALEHVSLENARLTQLEDKLLLAKHHIWAYEAFIRRFTGCCVPAFAVFTEMQKSLGFTVSPAFSSALETQLESKDNFQLLLFFILLGKAEDKQKAEAIWYAFDTELNNSLSKSDFSNKIKELITSSYVFTLETAIQLETSDDFRARYMDWRRNLTEKTDQLAQKLVKHFVGESDYVIKDEFLLKVNDRPDGNILGGTELRALLDDTKFIPNKFANAFKNVKITKPQQ